MIRFWVAVRVLQRQEERIKHWRNWSWTESAFIRKTSMCLGRGRKEIIFYLISPPTRAWAKWFWPVPGLASEVSLDWLSEKGSEPEAWGEPSLPYSSGSQSVLSDQHLLYCWEFIKNTPDLLNQTPLVWSSRQVVLTSTLRILSWRVIALKRASGIPDLSPRVGGWLSKANREKNFPLLPDS